MEPRTSITGICVGDQLGGYQILELLGDEPGYEHFLARPLEARDPDARVLLKWADLRRSEERESRAMRFDEGRWYATWLRHPNIPRVLETRLEDGCALLVMEPVRGVSLRSLLAARPLSLAATIAAGCQLTDALHYAHQLRTPRGEPLQLIHRGISPEVILIDRGGRMQLLGFEHMAPGKPGRSHAHSGPQYWAPEVCRGLQPDLRADLFSAALVLYEASTGHYPFPVTSFFDTLLAITKHDVPPPSSRRAHYPAELERVLLTALSRDPTRRPESARQLQLELEEIAESLGIDHRSYPRRPLAELVAERG